MAAGAPESLAPAPAPASASARCLLCGAGGLRDVFRLPSVPVVCNQLWADAEAARAAARVDIDLAVCPDCALVANRSFRPELIAYAPGYENALHFSPRFQAFARGLCADLVARHALAGRDVVEIGCGDGHVLALMVEAGARSATGFDPSMAGRETPFAATPGVEIVPEYFRAGQLDRPFDMVLCRHVLEHLPDPLAVLREIRAAVADRGCPVYVEVPNAAWMLDLPSMWDVIYEHVTYWTPASLETLFRRAGFAPLSIGAVYDGQFLAIEARPAEPEPEFLPDPAARDAVVAACARFAGAAEAVLGEWRDRLGALARASRRAVVWGAGSKGITFANAVGADGACLAALVDVNARKHGRFVPGVALPVAGPDEIAGLAPDLVLISNELYADEIARAVAERGLAPEFGVIAG